MEKEEPHAKDDESGRKTKTSKTGLKDTLGRLSETSSRVGGTSHSLETEAGGKVMETDGKGEKLVDCVCQSDASAEKRKETDMKRKIEQEPSRLREVDLN